MITEKEQRFIVYMHINKINTKKYIGITCQKASVRWNSGRGYAHNKYFSNAIKKYGWNNFEHKILFENLTEQEAKQKEIKLIADYHTCIFDPNCWGYNLSIGGESGSKYETNEARQLAIDESHARSYKKRRSNEQSRIAENTRMLTNYYKDKQDKDKYDHRKELHRKINAKRRLDPEKHAKDVAAAKVCQQKVNEIRAKLRKLAKSDKIIFSEEQKKLAFGYCESKANKQFVCNSYKKLSAIYEQLLNEVKNYDNK